ncbi:MAG: hypothetical protein KatS3mg035_0686 [Bacteroidia bacterium]|nr:MAG: hypothetical protein KatS3mg035_0686 [Bacteroidia bacterium]
MRRTSIIYLVPTSLSESISLPVMAFPKEQKRAASISITYLAFQLTGFTQSYVTITARELLPRVFTLIHQKGGRYIFCGTFRHQIVARIDAFPLGSVMLCVARTFLPLYCKEAIEQLVKNVITLSKDS